MPTDAERRKINAQMYYDCFVETLEAYSTEILKMSDDELEEYLFDEVDGKIYAWLNEDHLNTMEEFGYIDAQIHRRAKALYQSYQNLDGSQLWDIQYVRTALEWSHIFYSAERILYLLKFIK